MSLKEVHAVELDGLFISDAVYEPSGYNAWNRRFVIGSNEECSESVVTFRQFPEQFTLGSTAYTHVTVKNNRTDAPTILTLSEDIAPPVFDYLEQRQKALGLAKALTAAEAEIELGKE